MSTFWTRFLHWLGRGSSRNGGWVEPWNAVTDRVLAGPVTLSPIGLEPWTPAVRVAPATVLPAALDPAPVATPAPPVRHVIDDLAPDPISEPIRFPGRAA